MTVVNWIVNNWNDIATIIAYIIAVASIVVKLTPTLKDDTVMKQIIRFVGRYIALNK